MRDDGTTVERCSTNDNNVDTGSTGIIGRIRYFYLTLTEGMTEVMIKDRTGLRIFSAR